MKTVHVYHDERLLNKRSKAAFNQAEKNQIGLEVPKSLVKTKVDLKAPPSLDHVKTTITKSDTTEKKSKSKSKSSKKKKD